MEKKKGIEQAVALGWYDLETFNLEEYEYWEQPLNGDMSVVFRCVCVCV